VRHRSLTACCRRRY